MDENGNIIASDAQIGNDLRIGHFCVIHPCVVIGNNVTIRSFVELRPGTIIGNNCYIDSGVRSSGQNQIGSNVTLRYGAIIARGCYIEDDVYICPQVMTNNLDHNRKPIGGARIGKGSFIGTNTTLGAGIQIVPGTIIGAKSLVTKDIIESGVYVGIPARRIK